MEATAAMEHNHHDHEERADNFECNICYDICQKPVVTTCGHLFCWPCIYQWINTNRTFLTCPVCKNGISEQRLVSIYSREERPTPNAQK
jgi:E3 ubiquitin-protein ligase RNF5